MPFIKVDVHVHVHGLSTNSGDIAQQLTKFENKMNEQLEQVKELLQTANNAVSNVASIVTAVNTSVSGIADDTAYLKERIEALSTTGATPEQIAEVLTLAQNLSSNATGVSDQLQSASAQLAELDAATNRPTEEQPAGE